MVFEIFEKCGRTDADERTSEHGYTIIKMSSLKNSENIRKKECGLDRSVSNNKFSSVTL